MTTCSTCTKDSCTARERRDGESARDYEDRQQLASRLCTIRRKIVVLSGKGGVGKSTVAVNLALALALAGRRVGLLDVDIHGPSIPTLLHLGGRRVAGGPDGVEPMGYENLKVMSIGFLLDDDREAVIWRGPAKYGVIRQFLSTVRWGELDVMVVDCPPGTGDEPLSVIQLLERVDGAVIVTTPQDLALVDVRKSVTFCRRLDVPVLGVIENMSGFVCPHCGETVDVFKSGGSRTMAAEFGIPFLGAIPLNPDVVRAGDDGRPFIYHYRDTETGQAFCRALEPLVDGTGAP